MLLFSQQCLYNTLVRNAKLLSCSVAFIKYQPVDFAKQDNGLVSRWFWHKGYLKFSCSSF